MIDLTEGTIELDGVDILKVKALNSFFGPPLVIIVHFISFSNKIFGNFVLMKEKWQKNVGC